MSEESPKTYQDDNIFAQILSGKIPSVKLFENDDCLAILDAFPQSKGHSLLIPKSPSRNLLDADPGQLATILPEVQKLALATKSALKADGIKIAQFNETAAGQTVFHLHFHIIPAFDGVEIGQHASQMVPTEELNEIAEKIRAKLS
ncbi:Bis(5'-nucleosyl)-tetraphosphatase (asymmetrical) [hydrothermal vent metagenome]|uniref:Bis(5'-nucleosyl)-tetraphosphatase (Asymmetrical) n=1 Tax=hydrothermal vent metagenome TaxID=652676 RepID=A0A3B0U8T5_9ZZZZ